MKIYHKLQNPPKPKNRPIFNNIPPHCPIRNMVHSTIRHVIHGLRTICNKIFHLLTHIPNCHAASNNRKQHVPPIYRLRRRRNHILPPHRLMAGPSRSQHCRPTGRNLQPSWRHRPNPEHSMTSINLQHLRNSTSRTPPPNPHPPPPRTNPRRCREIRTIWPTPMTTCSHGRPHPRICPITLQHHSRSRDLPTYPHTPATSLQPNSPNCMSMPRRPVNPIRRHMRPNPKRH